MIGFLFFLALQPILRKTEGRVNLRYVQVVYCRLDCRIVEFPVLTGSGVCCCYQGQNTGQLTCELYALTTC